MHNLSKEYVLTNYASWDFVCGICLIVLICLTLNVTRNIVSLGTLFTALQHAYKRFVQSQSYSRRGHFYFISGVLIRMRKCTVRWNVIQLLRCKYWNYTFLCFTVASQFQSSRQIWKETWGFGENNERFLVYSRELFMVYIVNEIWRVDHKCMLSFFIMQWAEKSYSIDIVISRHIHLPNVTLFSWLLKIENDWKCTTHSVKMTDKDICSAVLWFEMICCSLFELNFPKPCLP